LFVAAHNNTELVQQSPVAAAAAAASEDSFWSESPAAEQAQQLRELDQLRGLQQRQLVLQQTAYQHQQLANQQQQ